MEVKTKLVLAAVAAVVIAASAVVATRQKPDPVTGADPGATGDRSCGSEAYGMDCRIVEYLERNVAFTSRGGTAFCSYERLGPEKDGELYLHALCEEMYVKDGKLLAGSGSSVPLRLTRTAEGGFVYWMPRDGSAYALDMKENFPKEYRDADSVVDTYGLGAVNEERAERALGVRRGFSIEKVTGLSCASVLDCETPAEYLVQSRCPFASKCLDGKCVVVCPDF